MMAIKRIVVPSAIAMAAILMLSACERKISVTETVTGPLSCSECHDPSNVITGKKAQWEMSVHGTGEAYLRGTSSSCAGCHSGNGFKGMVEAGQNPGTVTAGDPDPTRQDCRACHDIHNTYTTADFKLRTTAPVAFYSGTLVGTTFDGGEGNLCVNCHQPRRTIPAAVNDTISGISSHWGPHHGPQSVMLMGMGGAGVADMPGPHMGVPNTCVTCHMGDGRNHEFEPNTDNCQSCHPGLDTFDRNNVQTDVQALTDSLGAKLLALGLINENGPDGHPIVTKAQTQQAQALWNWIYVAHEDKSLGVHNSDYAKALLQAGLAALPGPSPEVLTARRD